MPGRPISKPRPVPARRKRWLWLTVAIAAAAAFGNAGFRRLVTRWWEVRRLEGELKQLEAERSVLEGRIEGARRAGPDLERAARRDLGYLKPGEVEYRFPPPSRSTRSRSGDAGHDRP